MDARGVFTSEGTTKRGWASDYLLQQYRATWEKNPTGRYMRTSVPRLSIDEIYRRSSTSDEALVLLHGNGYLTDASPDLSGKFDFFLRDAEVKAAQLRVRQAKLSAIAAKQARLTDSGTGGPPLIPPEVFKLVDEGDGDWRSRITADAGISKKAIHEWASFVQLAKNGHAVHLRRDSDEEGVANPDIYLDGVLTEVKAPKGGTKNTIAGIVRKAKSQSSQVVIDTIRANLSVAEIEAYSRKALERYTEVNRIMVMAAEKEVWVSNE
ncbi:hypothetical protein PAB09_01555 [Corynebacterium sp. SCR221107]|uniref:CdiA C-terminal domain-containing protein n=1 Tax=Corynebacterium sp. SCR221107 TaxID=3017361 RepID=UPI0022EC34C2|nr:hypothetical protein [Corynebacterium sp. SCR221107]WBT09058.1 hypothetical protein PAB09_01555 [Corynebacterium sp. SCR221107]